MSIQKLYRPVKILLMAIFIVGAFLIGLAINPGNEESNRVVEADTYKMYFYDNGGVVIRTQQGYVLKDRDGVLHIRSNRH